MNCRSLSKRVGIPIAVKVSQFKKYFLIFSILPKKQKNEPNYYDYPR